MASSPSDKGSLGRPPSPPPENSSSSANNNDFTIDLALEDDTLTALDKIYLFTTSKAPFHRIFITHSLHEYLKNVPPHDAIRYVLPLIGGLAMDSDEQVKEALAAELEQLIWWFFTNCQVVPDCTQSPTDEDMTPPEITEISVQSFTPILGTLLLSSNPLVGGAARHTIVDLLSRLKQADEEEQQSLNQLQSQNYRNGTPPSTGLFGRDERECFRNEILQQIVIGMARLDFDSDSQYDQASLMDEHLSPGCQSPPILMGGQVHSPSKEALSSRQHSENINPYFPVDVASYNNDLLRPKSPKSAQSPKSPLSPLDNINGALSHLSTASSPNHISDLSRFPPSQNEAGAKSPNSQVPRSPTEDKLAKLPAPAEHTDEDSLGQMGLRHEPEVSDIPIEIEDEHAAVGRLSSMSLMAAVAAGGYLDLETQKAFVEEVERVGQDSVYWVRREASFALGALSKVVPEELVLCTLLPLFEKLRIDSSWHVRHSSLFALPAILTRLPRPKRRSLAIETITNLASDEVKLVRSGVLESLGEVLLTFKNEDEGPPDKLLQMFLGRREDKRLRDGQQPICAIPTTREDNSALGSFFSDPDRPLICAFNFPAVALTLGKDRWKDIRDVYLELATFKAVKVQRTLAASLGELAHIIGPENTQCDLLRFWQEFIWCQEEEVRMKAIEATPLFIQNLAPRGDRIVTGLVVAWDGGVFTSWRERGYIAKSLVDFMLSVSSQAYPAVIDLLKRALEDGVANVRETAVSALPRIWNHMSEIQGMLSQLKANLNELANSDTSKRRMTFILCQQALVKFDIDDRFSIPLDNEFWRSISRLAEDSIIDVRIGVARLVNVIVDERSFMTSATPLLEIINRLSKDPSGDVQSFVLNLSGLRDRLQNIPPRPSLPRAQRSEPRSEFATFSRPPPFRVTPFPRIALNDGHRVDNHSNDGRDPKRPDYRITISSSSISVAKSAEGRTATITIRDDSGIKQDRNTDHEVEAGVNLKPSIPNASLAMMY